MKRILFMTVFAATVVGCSHAPSPHPESRQPSNEKMDQFTVQGRVGMSVSKADAGIDDDLYLNDSAFYVIQVDCDGDRLFTTTEQRRIIKVEAKTASKKQHRIFTAYKKRSERQNKTGGALPYLKVSLTTSDPAELCKSGKAGKIAYGTNPKFEYVK